MAALHSKLKQYEKRQRRRKELMEHITSFLREEDEEEDQNGKPATTPPRSPSVISSHPPPSCQSTPSSQPPDIELHAKRHVSATQLNASTPAAEAEHFEPGFVPIQPVTSLPLYSPISSGTLPAAVPHATRAETVPLGRERHPKSTVSSVPAKTTTSLDAAVSKNSQLLNFVSGSQRGSAVGNVLVPMRLRYAT